MLYSGCPWMYLSRIPKNWSNASNYSSTPFRQPLTFSYSLLEVTHSLLGFPVPSQMQSLGTRPWFCSQNPAIKSLAQHHPGCSVNADQHKNVRSTPGTVQCGLRSVGTGGHCPAHTGGYPRAKAQPQSHPRLHPLSYSPAVLHQHKQVKLH